MIVIFKKRGSGISIGMISEFRGQIRTEKRWCISNFYDLNYSTSHTTGDDMSLIDLFLFFITWSTCLDGVTIRVQSETY